MIRLTANMTTGSDHDTVTWDERVVSYKKLTHWNIAQCFSKIKSDLENVSFSLEDAKTFFEISESLSLHIDICSTTIEKIEIIDREGNMN